jgi:prephenate dehydratase
MKGLFGTVIALSIAVLIVFTQAASSATAKKIKKVSLEQAWAQCLNYVDSNYPKGSGDNDRQRASQGMACLQRLGYRP